MFSDIKFVSFFVYIIAKYECTQPADDSVPNHV